MYAYRILYVEDEIEEACGRLASFFPDLKGRLKVCDDRNDIQAVLDEQYPFVDFEDTLEGALSKLAQGAERYLLFIVDRDLGKRQEGSIDTIKKVWPTISEDVYADKKHRSGDLILEYLLLESELCKPRLLHKFYFLTNWKDLGNVATTLSFLHFSEEECAELVVEKPDTIKLRILEAAVHDPVRIHIQEKHNAVFTALRAVAPGLNLDPDEYASALVDAFSQIDGVALAEKEPKRPDIDLLRQIGEAICEKEEVEAKWIFAAYDWATEMQGYFRNLKDRLDSRPSRIELGLLACMAGFGQEDRNDPGNAFGNLFDVNRLKAQDLFNPGINHKALTLTQVGYIDAHRKKYQHIADILNLLQHMSSQAIHFNEYGWREGYRLHLIVHAVSELLLFYHKELLTEED